MSFTLVSGTRICGWFGLPLKYLSYPGSDQGVKMGYPTRFMSFLMLAGLGPAPVSAIDCSERLFVDDFESTAAARWQVAVEVSELGDSGRSVTFELDAIESLTFTTDGLACFETRVVNGVSYSVVIESQPTEGNACVLDNATGIATGPVTVDARCDSTLSLWDRLIWDQDAWQ